MIIAISGVPGVGKSQVAKLLAKNLKAQPISITALLKAGKIPCTWDRSRKTKIISVRDTQYAINKITRRQPRATYVIEGHLAHLLRADKIFILRCNPEALIRRLLKRGWSKKKIAENIQAEALDIITSEAVGKRSVYEIDTTRKSPKQTTDVMLKIMKSEAYAKRFRPGKIRWLEPRNMRL